MLLQHAFESSCARLPSKVALVCGDERITYGALASRVEALATQLRARQVTRGDRVAVLLESSIEFAVAVHAVLAAGAVFVPISAQTKADKLAYLLADTRATALLTHAQLDAAWRAAIDRCPSVQTVVVKHEGEGEGQGEDSGEGAADPRVLAWPRPAAAAEPTLPATGAAGGIDQDLAAIIYTSGTTGLPKGVMLTHLNMCSAWRSVQQYLQLREDDIIGLALPPSFSYGLYNLLMGLGLGATVVIERSAAFPVRLAENLAREHITVFPGVPTLFSALLGLSDLARFDLSALRIVTNAAAALPDAHITKLRSLVPRARFFSMYGMTECKRISFMPPEQLADHPGSVGRGLPNQAHWLVDGSGQRLPHGSTGELVVRGSHVMRGYWDKPAETAERLRPGPLPGELVLHTGDIFRSDAEGWLYFVARSDDIIKTRGEKVAPREVENTLHSLDAVLDCAVIGIPDALLGQAVKAFVTLKPGSTLSEREVIRHCLSRLESHMAPKSVEFVAELPRTDSGKIRKLDLR